MELRQWGDGSEEGSDCGGRSFGGRKRGWVPASARTTGGGTVNLPRLHGGGLFAGKTGGGRGDHEGCNGYGRGDGSPHPRGQRGVGRLIFHVFTGAGSSRENGCGWGWIPAFAGMTKGGAVFWRMTGGSRTAPTEENVVGHGVHPPSPVFTRAGSNLPPSRGKGLVGAERAIFIVMTCFTKGDGFSPSREKREVGGATVRDAPSRYGRGDGSPHPRGQRRGTVNLPRLHGGGLCAGKTGEWGAGFRLSPE